MRIGIWCTALLALGMAGGIVSHSLAQAPGDDYRGAPHGRSGISLDVTVTQVDADRDRVLVTGDDGHAYTLDTYQAKIVLRDTDHPGQTGDLVTGMRLHVTGSPLSPDLIETDRVSVLPYRSARPTRPEVSPGAPTAGQDRRITLRGTVQSVDDRRAMIVVQVNDHTRKVFLNDQTELRDLPDGDSDRVPVRPGDRLTVVGDLQKDGTVQATLLTPRRLDDALSATRPTPAPRPTPDGSQSFGDTPHGRTLVGRVSKECGYISRDIKIRLSGDREITVQIPKDALVRRDGSTISIHDVKEDQIVRVSGDYVNDDFRATHIDVLDDTDANRDAF